MTSNKKLLSLQIIQTACFVYFFYKSVSTFLNCCFANTLKPHYKARWNLTQFNHAPQNFAANFVLIKGLANAFSLIMWSRDMGPKPDVIARFQGTSVSKTQSSLQVLHAHG